VLAGLVQLILVEDNVEHLGGALGQLLSRHQLHVDVSRLRLRQHNFTGLKGQYHEMGASLICDSGF
jgi:hypothetical protein